MTRTEKWRYKRVELDAERQMFQTMLLNASEELMKVHSEITESGSLVRTAERKLDDYFDTPLDQLDELMTKLKNKKGFLCD